jgi:hypothetical protein
LSNFNFILENLLGLKDLSLPSHAIKITIPPSNTSESRQAKQVLAPTRVQPSRANRGNRMAGIIADIEEDDDSRTIMPRQKKRPIVESDPEDGFDVPKEIECNPMAPATKKRRPLDVENPPRSIPPLLSLQPTTPTQFSPSLQLKPKPRPVSKFRFHLLPYSTSESQPQPQFHLQPQNQSFPAATSNPSIPSNPSNENDSIQEEDRPVSENDEESSERGRYEDRNLSGLFLLFQEFLYSNTATLQTLTIFISRQSRHTTGEMFIRITLSLKAETYVQKV